MAKDAVTDTTSNATAGARPALHEFDPRTILLSVGLSLLINGVLPFLVYVVLEPRFPSGSVMPLLYACAFPVIGLILGYVRTRVIDAIAMFALFGIAFSIVAVLVADNVRLALILGSTQGLVIGLGFLVSAMIGKPLVYYILGEFLAGNDPARLAHFAAVNRLDGGRTFRVATLAWAGGLAFLSAAGLIFATTLPPATYLLAAQVFNTSGIVLFVVWTIRFTSRRLAPVAARLEAA